MNTVNVEAVNEPTMRYQLFLQTTSKRHIEAGAPYRLTFSANKLEHVMDFIRDEVDLTMDSLLLKDKEAEF